MPTTKAEQFAIATILSDIDTELAALETKLAKARQIKQAMMQALREDIQRGADSGAGVPAKKAFADVRKRIAATVAAAVKLLVSPAAQADLMDIAAFIAQDNPAHWLAPTHGQRFRALMDQALPAWEMHRAQLNRLPVRHEDWQY